MLRNSSEALSSDADRDSDCRHSQNGHDKARSPGIAMRKAPVCLAGYKQLHESNPIGNAQGQQGVVDENKGDRDWEQGQKDQQKHSK